jgi:hypothetical protein
LARAPVGFRPAPRRLPPRRNSDCCTGSFLRERCCLDLADAMNTQISHGSSRSIEWAPLILNIVDDLLIA